MQLLERLCLLGYDRPLAAEALRQVSMPDSSSPDASSHMDPFVNPGVLQGSLVAHAYRHQGTLNYVRDNETSHVALWWPL